VGHGAERETREREKKTGAARRRASNFGGHGRAFRMHRCQGRACTVRKGGVAGCEACKGRGAGGPKKAGAANERVDQRSPPALRSRTSNHFGLPLPRRLSRPATPPTHLTTWSRTARSFLSRMVQPPRPAVPGAGAARAKAAGLGSLAHPSRARDWENPAVTARNRCVWEKRRGAQTEGPATRWVGWKGRAVPRSRVDGAREESQCPSKTTRRAPLRPAPSSRRPCCPRARALSPSRPPPPSASPLPSSAQRLTYPSAPSTTRPKPWPTLPRAPPRPSPPASALCLSTAPGGSSCTTSRKPFPKACGRKASTTATGRT
jgi:hypothetical protein